jgi:hypothetical protein
VKQELQEVINFFSASTQRTVGILVVILTLLALPITILQSQQTQSLQQEAAGKNQLVVTVFQDTNSSGTLDPGENGVSGVKVFATTQNAGYSSYTTGTTKTNGIATLIPPTGNTQVSIKLPIGYLMTAGYSPTQIIQTGGYNAVSFPLRQDPSIATPTPPKYSITGFVIIDANKNGIWDCVNICDGREGDELGYKGATVTNAEGKIFVTNSAGFYQSLDVYEGYNSVKLALPAGYLLVSPNNVSQWYLVSPSRPAGRVNYFIAPN